MDDETWRERGAKERNWLNLRKTSVMSEFGKLACTRGNRWVLDGSRCRWHITISHRIFSIIFCSTYAVEMHLGEGYVWMQQHTFGDMECFQLLMMSLNKCIFYTIGIYNLTYRLTFKVGGCSYVLPYLNNTTSKVLLTTLEPFPSKHTCTVPSLNIGNHSW